MIQPWPNPLVVFVLTFRRKRSSNGGDGHGHGSGRRRSELGNICSAPSLNFVTMEVQMTRLQEKARAQTKQAIGQMIGDDKLVQEGKEEARRADAKDAAEDQGARDREKQLAGELEQAAGLRRHSN